MFAHLIPVCQISIKSQHQVGLQAQGRHIDASRIEEEESIGIVFFKMSLSTGWDCPRAEVMMSFRRAKDHTYIAQLLGRMVRTPLARRIEADASLNDVHLYLPHYDQDAVNAVIEDLKDVENVPPSETGTARELVILHRREGLEDVFEALKELVTYRVNAVRKQSALRRLMGLGRGLTRDRIDEEAQKRVKYLIVDKMTEEIEKLRVSGMLDAKVKSITGIELKTIAVEKQTVVLENYGECTVEAVFNDIERLPSSSKLMRFTAFNVVPDPAKKSNINAFLLFLTTALIASLTEYIDFGNGNEALGPNTLFTKSEP